MQKSLKPNTLLAILTALNFLNYFDRFILASVAESIGHHFTLSDTEIGSLSTAFMLGYFLTSPFFGYLGDRVKRKWLIAFGIFVWSIGTVLTAYASTYSELIIYRILVGLGEASYATVSPALIADNFPEQKRNKALTRFYVAIPLGAAFGTLFGSWVGESYGWQRAFLLAGAPGILFAFSLLPFAEKKLFTANDNLAEVKPGLSDVFGLFKIKEFNLVIWGYVAYAFALGAYQYWGQVFFQRIHNLSPSSAGSYLGGVMVVTGLLGTFLGGHIASKYQQRCKSGYAMVCGYAILCAFPFCIAFTLSSSLLVTQLSLAIAMLLLFVPTGPVNTIILESVPSNLRATATAISIFSIHAFGDLWSPMIVGKISDHFGNLRYGVMALLPAIFICSMFWIYLARVSKKN